MNRKFVYTQYFEKRWKDLGLTDEDLLRLEDTLKKDFHVGKVIRGTNGLRKMRFAFSHKGKRSGVRVCYIDIEIKETVFFMDVYSKHEKVDLSADEIKLINKAIVILKGE